jgi:hypothetical protein
MKNLSRLMRSDLKKGFLGNINMWWIFSRAFVLLSLGALLLWNLFLAIDMINLNMNDFGKFYYSAIAFLKGRNMYDINPAMMIPVSALEYHIFTNLNPPHFTIIVLPFAFFSQKTALLLWFFINVFFLWISLLIIFRELEVKFSLWRVTLLVTSILAFAGTGTVVVTGQLSFIIMFLITLFWLESRHGRWNRAAIYLGLSMSIKLFLLIFLPYLLLRKQWRAVIVASGVALSCYCLGIMIFGWDNYRIWLNGFQSVNWSWASMNASIQGFLARLLAPSYFYQPLLLTKPVLVKLLWMVTSGLIGATTLGLTIHDTRKEEVDCSYALLLVAAQLISPLGWLYYSFLSFGPLIAVGVTRYRSWQEKKGAERTLLKARNALIIFSFLGFVIPFNFLVSLQPSTFITLTLGSAYFWATLALWTGLCFDSMLTWKQVPPKLAWAWSK